MVREPASKPLGYLRCLVSAGCRLIPILLGVVTPPIGFLGRTLECFDLTFTWPGRIEFRLLPLKLGDIGLCESMRTNRDVAFLLRMLFLDRC
jgi:hypothetical protein